MAPLSVSTTLAAPTTTSLLSSPSIGGNNAFSRNTQQFPTAFPNAGAESLGFDPPHHTNDPVYISPSAPSITVTMTASDPTDHGLFPTATQSDPSWRPQATSLPDNQPESENETKKSPSGWVLFGEWVGLTLGICTVSGLGTYAGHKGYQAWDKNGRPRLSRSDSRWFPSVRRRERSLCYAPIVRGSHRGDGDGTELYELPQEAPPVYKAHIGDDTACSEASRPLQSYNGGDFVMSGRFGEERGALS